MSLTVNYCFGGCITINTGETNANKASKKALSLFKKSLMGVINNQFTMTVQDIEEVANSNGEVTLEISGNIFIPIDTNNPRIAEEASWEIIEDSYQKDIPGFGNFEYHDGKIISIS